MFAGAQGRSNQARDRPTFFVRLISITACGGLHKPIQTACLFVATLHVTWGMSFERSLLSLA